MAQGTLYRMLVATHAFLFIVCAINTSPRFKNGAMLHIANFVGLGLQIYANSKVAIEIYDAQPLAWMNSE